MKGSSIHPRPDQIAELTRNITLPLPALDTDHLEIISEKLVEAFDAISLVHRGTVQGGSEAEVTAMLVSRLNSMLDEDRLLSQLMICATRGTESLSFDGSHLEKRPDISIQLTNRARGFPLIAEAKLIDVGKDAKLYCDNGVRRFVEGEYAWGSREALMIAYVRDKSTITGNLTPYLNAVAGQTPPGYLVEELGAAYGTSGADIALSTHGRNFLYPHAGPPPVGPGSIVLWHVWLT
ncbi:hypothetical protein [Affinirhizobium pseudoryzae]|uniref:hypothetical protein n=1 Tax=Allorhizobium pseudoryzae TaxID=379684 RepID=UPI001F4801A2|nr:hypothetical protein [Allorhizobium pseudoryzae]